MELSINLELISVGLAILSIAILGVVVFLNNRKSITNQIFFLFSLVAVVWNILNYASTQFLSETVTLWVLRFVMFFAIWYCFLLFELYYVIPKERVDFPKYHVGIFLPIAIIVSLFSLSPYVFSGIAEKAPIGSVSTTVVGYGIVIFGATALMFVSLAFISLFRKLKKAKESERKQLFYILAGGLITFSLYLAFNFVSAAIFSNVRFIPLGAVFTFPLIALTAYAVVKYHLFNVKVIATQLFTFALWIFLFIKTLLSDSPTDVLVNSVTFILTIVVGIFLIRSVVEEVDQREEMESLASRLKDATSQLRDANKELKKLDQAKSDFISIASHQLRTPLTVIKGYISMIQEGSFGKVPKKIGSNLTKVFASNERLIALVENLLDISRIESGRQQFEWSQVDLKDLTKTLTENLIPTAEASGLKLEFVEPTEPIPVVVAEFNKLHDVMINFIDNAIKYTKEGSIKVSLKPEPKGMVTFCVKDTGRGIAPDVLPNLFQKFSRGQGSFRVNTEGSGLGLYVAKMVVDAHEGKIWAESEGRDKGSAFCFSIPVKGPKDRKDLPFAKAGQKVVNPVKSSVRNVPNAPQPSAKETVTKK